jgi:hypothetical protein
MKIDFNKLNEFHPKVYPNEVLKIEDLLSIEFRANLITGTLVEDDFSIFFSRQDKDGKKYLSGIERIQNGQIKEYYKSNFKSLHDGFEVMNGEKKTNIRFIKTDFIGYDLIPFIEEMLDSKYFMINQNYYLNNYNSYDINNNPEDIYFYVWASPNIKRHNFIVNKKFYNKNFAIEILRYNYYTHKLNKIYICHHYFNNDYPYEVLKPYNPWQVFYYFTPDNLDEPKECLFDPRRKEPATQELFRHYFDQDIPNYTAIDSPDNELISTMEYKHLMKSIKAGKDITSL